jgi:glucose-6-phosphate isomerase
MSRFIPPQQRPAWQGLATLAQRPLHLRDLLQQAERAKQCHIEGAGLTLDFTHQRVDAAVMAQLLALAEQSDVQGQWQAMLRGEAINSTERRAVLHVALRGSHVKQPPWGSQISEQVAHELDRVCHFAEQVRAGELKGHTGLPITDVVNLGIGGSDLGPRMTTRALEHLRANSFDRKVSVHYVSNVDAWGLYTTLARLKPAQTLFIVQSKTFTTQETMTLAASAHRWLLDGGCPADALAQHLVAVTATPALPHAQGYKPEHIFEFWDWVGGRYSVWSAIGLPLAIGIGAEAFRAFLQGARDMDAHFDTTPPERNLPLWMALLGIWNRNFLRAPSLNIAPYVAPLAQFAAFLQQLEMESNGKRTHIDGSPVQVDTAALVWGGLGINGQHAYFQMIHQGTHLVPIDFIGVRTEHSPLPLAAEHHRVVILNLQAQARAFAVGRNAQETAQQLRREGLSEAEVAELTPHRTYPGNVPSSTLWMDALTPHALGSLIALYEHKVFCQAAIWGIHAFDQWGVELGKSMARALENDHPNGNTKGNP